jgi:hypothetical protein
MLYTIESTLGGFGDVLVEIFALPKACHSGSVGVKYLITDMADGGQFWSLQINANLRIVRTYHRFVIPLLWCFSWGETPPFRNKDQNQVL